MSFRKGTSRFPCRNSGRNSCRLELCQSSCSRGKETGLRCSCVTACCRRSSCLARNAARSAAGVCSTNQFFFSRVILRVRVGRAISDQPNHHPHSCLPHQSDGSSSEEGSSTASEEGSSTASPTPSGSGRLPARERSCSSGALRRRESRRCASFFWPEL